MRFFPFEYCPPADDLLSYERGTADEDLRRRVEAHIATCGICARARTHLKRALSTLDELAGNSTNEGFLAYVRGQAPKSAGLTEQRMAEQQNRMSKMLADPRPAPAIGQIWAVLHHEEQDALSHLVLVLDQYVSAATGQRRVNVVPVTLDDSLASEWSLIFDGKDSGVGFHTVIHVDFERSAPIECLDRCIGQLPAAAGSELLDVVRAWSRSEAPASGLAVGRLGRPEIRTRIDWQAFANWLTSSMQAICDSPDADILEERCDALLDGPTSLTGGATVPSSPRPANPSPVRRPTVAHGLDLIRPATLASRPSEVHDALARTRRVAENRHVYGDTPGHASEAVNQQSGSSPGAEALPLAPSTGFLDAVREYLITECGNDLTRWSKMSHQSIRWEQLGLVSDFSIADLESEGWRSRLVPLIKGQPQPVRTSILAFVNDLRYFRVQRAGSLTGETLGQQAARRQTPPSSRPRQK